MSLIFPKKEILYAPMLGTLGGGSASGFGRGKGKSGPQYLNANAPRVFMGHNTGLGIQVQNMDDGVLVRTISYSNDNFSWAHMGYQTFDYYATHSSFGLYRYDEAGVAGNNGIYYQGLQSGNFANSAMIQTNRAETEIYTINMVGNGIVTTNPTASSSTQYGIPSTLSTSNGRPFFIDHNDDKYYQNTSNQIVRWGGAGGTGVTHYSGAYSTASCIVVPWTDPEVVLVYYQDGNLRAFNRSDMSLRWERSTGLPSSTEGIIVTHPDDVYVVWHQTMAIAVVNNLGQRISIFTGGGAGYSGSGMNLSNVYNVFSDYDGLFITHDNGEQAGWTLSAANSYQPQRQWFTQYNYNISQMAGACPWSEQNKLFDATE